MKREGLRKRLRGLFRVRSAEDGVDVRQDAPPVPEATEWLVRPDGRERISFRRRSDGLWDYVVDAFSDEEVTDMGLVPGYWHPVHVSGLHDSLATARREAGGARAWVEDGIL